MRVISDSIAHVSTFSVHIEVKLQNPKKQRPREAAFVRTLAELLAHDMPDLHPRHYLFKLLSDLPIAQPFANHAPLAIKPILVQLPNQIDLVVGQQRPRVRLVDSPAVLVQDNPPARCLLYYFVKTVPSHGAIGLRCGQAAGCSCTLLRRSCSNCIRARD